MKQKKFSNKFIINLKNKNKLGIKNDDDNSRSVTSSPVNDDGGDGNVQSPKAIHEVLLSSSSDESSKIFKDNLENQSVEVKDNNIEKNHIPILRSDTNNHRNDLKVRFNGLEKIKSKKIDSTAHGKCKFNGYSNNEIIIFFILALLVTILIASDYSYIISHVSFCDILFNNLLNHFYLIKNVLLPFFTLEIAHAIAHFKYIPVSHIKNKILNLFYFFSIFSLQARNFKCFQFY